MSGVALATLLAACQSSSTERTPQEARQKLLERYDKVVVLALNEGPSRVQWEDAIVRMLERKGARAIASHKQFPQLYAVGTDEFATWIDSLEYNGLLTVIARGAEEVEGMGTTLFATDSTFDEVAAVNASAKEVDADFCVEMALYDCSSPYVYRWTSAWAARTDLFMAGNVTPDGVGKAVVDAAAEEEFFE